MAKKDLISLVPKMFLDFPNFITAFFHCPDPPGAVWLLKFNRNLFHVLVFCVGACDCAVLAIVGVVAFLAKRFQVIEIVVCWIMVQMGNSEHNLNGKIFFWKTNFAGVLIYPAMVDGATVFAAVFSSTKPDDL